MEFHVLELPKFHFFREEELTRKKAWMIFLCGNRTILLKDITKRYDKINKLDNLLEKYWKEEKME